MKKTKFMGVRIGAKSDSLIASGSDPCELLMAAILNGIAVDIAHGKVTHADIVTAELLTDDLGDSFQRRLRGAGQRLPRNSSIVQLTLPEPSPSRQPAAPIQTFNVYSERVEWSA